MSNISIYKSYEDATRRYYGADKDQLRLVPVVHDKEVAHGVAIQVEKALGYITEERLVQSALRAQSRNRFMHGHGETNLEVLKEEAFQDALNRVVVNAELTHAHASPQDFHEDAMKSGAYEMGHGITIAPLPSKDDLRQ